MKTQTRSDMLSKDKIGALLIKLSLPAIISMFAYALYNTIDTIFIGQWVGTLGIGAVSVVLPILFLITAITQTVGIGGASLISRRMGAKDMPEAGLVLGNMVLLSILLGVIVQIVGLFALTPLLQVFGATEALLPIAQQYFQIYLLSGPLMTFSMVISNAIRSEGNAKMAMLTMIASVILNIILDPIFIGVLNMGIRGAAIATVISIGLASIVLLIYFVSGHSEIPFNIRYMRFKVKIIKEMLLVGASTFVRVGAMSLMVAILNHTLSHYGGDIGIATFAVIFRLLSFIFMPITGLSMGLQPIIGFNYGAKQFLRVRQCIKLTFVISTIVATMGFLVVLLFPEAIMKLFTKDPQLLVSGREALCLCMIFLPLAGAQAVGSAFFQALGQVVPAILLSLSRQVLALIPLILLLPRFFGLNGVWISLPVADLISFIITMIFVWAELKKIPKTVPTAFPGAVLEPSAQA